MSNFATQWRFSQEPIDGTLLRPGYGLEENKHMAERDPEAKSTLTMVNLPHCLVHYFSATFSFIRLIAQRVRNTLPRPER